MPRVGRIVIPGLAHHVTQRGNNRQDVFFMDDDRRVYLGLLAEQAEKHGLGVVGYCLMTNHVHLVVVPAREESLAKAVGRTHFEYTQYLHRLHGRSGHLWQNRFSSCAVEEPWAALRYVERNPVRARMVQVAWRYRWSSAAAHCNVGPVPGWLDRGQWGKVWSAEAWREHLRAREEVEIVEHLRLSTHTGRPLGSDAFLSKIEHLLGRRLRPLPVGRPRKGVEGDK
jgi:REP-associated tyrosine transposase